MRGIVLGWALFAIACGGGGGSGDGGGDGATTPDALPPRGLALGITQDLVGVGPGDRLELTLTITRGSDLHGDATITVSGLPDGVTADPLTAGSARTEVQLYLNADETAVAGTRATATIEGVVDGVTASTPLDLVVAGAPGTADGSFGTDGIVTTTAGRIPTDLFQSGGTIVVGGYAGDGSGAFLTGLGEDGAPAGGFQEFTSRFASPAANVTQARFAQRPGGGGYIAVAIISGDVWIAGVRADGGADATRPPVLLLDATGSFELGTVQVRSDDIVWIGGNVDGTAVLVEVPAGAEGSATTHRLTELGNATVVQLADDASRRTHLLARPPSGISPGGLSTPVVARLTSEREIDGTYGLVGLPAGVDTTALAHGLTFDPSGRLLVAGGAVAALPGDGGGDAVAWRLTSDGALDPGFSADGRFQQGTADSHEEMSWSIPGRGNRVYLVGEISAGALPEAGARTLFMAVDDLGRLDGGFGTGGAAAVGVELAPRAVLLQSAARLLVAGVQASTGQLVLARTWL